MSLSTSRMKGFKSGALIRMIDRTWKFNIECIYLWMVQTLLRESVQFLKIEELFSLLLMVSEWSIIGLFLLSAIYDCFFYYNRSERFALVQGHLFEREKWNRILIFWKMKSWSGPWFYFSFVKHTFIETFPWKNFDLLELCSGKTETLQGRSDMIKHVCVLVVSPNENLGRYNWRFSVSVDKILGFPKKH